VKTYPHSWLRRRSFTNASHDVDQFQHRSRSVGNGLINRLLADLLQSLDDAAEVGAVGGLILESFAFVCATRAKSALSVA
jgi:hypothetical protein